LSRELVRKLLGIGQDLLEVHPQPLRDLLHEELQAMSARFAEPGRLSTKGEEHQGLPATQ
jgi:hypothetical protein